MKSRDSKTVFVKIWTPGMRHIVLVHNAYKPDVGNGHSKPEGWGLPGGNQASDDIDDDPDADSEIADELRTAFREVLEETGIGPDDIEIKFLSREVRPREKRHVVVDYNATYFTDDVSRALRPALENGKIIEARWVPVEDLRGGKINGLVIHPSHLRIINGEQDTPYC